MTQPNPHLARIAANALCIALLAGCMPNTPEAIMGIMLQHTGWNKCLPVAEKIATQAPNIAVMVNQGAIAPKVQISATNFPQGDLDHLYILDHSERVPCETGTRVAGADGEDGEDAASPPAI